MLIRDGELSCNYPSPNASRASHTRNLILPVVALPNIERPGSRSLFADTANIHAFSCISIVTAPNAGRKDLCSPHLRSTATRPLVREYGAISASVNDEPHKRHCDGEDSRNLWKTSNDPHSRNAISSAELRYSISHQKLPSPGVCPACVGVCSKRDDTPHSLWRVSQLVSSSESRETNCSGSEETLEEL